MSRTLEPSAAAALVEHAGAAFTDAINVAMAVSAVISIIAGAIVLYAGRTSARARWRRRPSARRIPVSMSPPDVDPRIERSRTVILEATLDELADVGTARSRSRACARRAGVSKATVYRHWDGKLELVADAVGRLKHSVQPPETDDHRERIAGMLRGIAELLAGSRFAACVPAVISAAQRDEGLRDFHHTSSAERRAVHGRHPGSRARRRPPRSRPSTPNLLAELFVAPIFFRRLMTPTPFPLDDVDHLLTIVLDPHWH